MKEKRKDDAFLKAIKTVKGPDKDYKDHPANRPYLAGDLEAIKKAGEEGRKIIEATDEIRAENNNQAPKSKKSSE